MSLSHPCLFIYHMSCQLISLANFSAQGHTIPPQSSFSPPPYIVSQIVLVCPYTDTAFYAIYKAWANSCLFIQFTGERKHTCSWNMILNCGIVQNKGGVSRSLYVLWIWSTEWVLAVVRMQKHVGITHLASNNDQSDVFGKTTKSPSPVACLRQWNSEIACLWTWRIHSATEVNSWWQTSLPWILLLLLKPEVIHHFPVQNVEH